MKRQTIPYRLARACSGLRTRHLPLVRHFWRTSRRLMPARFQVRRVDGYGRRRAWATGWRPVDLLRRVEVRTR